MIKSMTGYGKAVCELKDKTVTIEIKSLNSKQADIYVRLPGIYREKETDIRNLIMSALKRGKIECIVSLECFAGEQLATINTDVVRQYYKQLLTVQDELEIQTNEPLLQTILRLPESLKTIKEELDEKEWEMVKAALISSLDQLDQFRSQEGEALESDIKARINSIEKLSDQLNTHEKARMEKIRERLKDNVSELLNPDMIDKNRFEQEVIYYLEKLDITEERVRLASHCSYFRQVLDEDDNTGKKLGFICQEIGREINTIGSKANDFEIQKKVVLMKDELEKIKEQLMNVL